MTVPTVEQILTLAPDESSVRAAKEQAAARKWKMLGSDGTAAWGEVQGSGATPYQTCLEIQANAFKCTCPSRKFPCKHGLGLFLLLAQQPTAFASAPPPDWVSQWLSQRQTKTKRAEADRSKPPDPVAQAKRASQRNANVQAGIEDLDRWLEDVIRRGLASVQHEGFSFWENQAKRLVDAQAPGLARMVKSCGGAAASGDGWQDRLLRQIGSISLLVDAYSRLEQLPEALQSDVKSAIGFTVAQDELLKQPGVRDTWAIFAQTIEQEERLRIQRTWAYGRTSRKYALILSFAHGTAPLDTSLLAGDEKDCELVFFPGAHQTRALLKGAVTARSELSGFYGYANFEEAMFAYATALSLNPWTERLPMAIDHVVPEHAGDGTFVLIDSDGASAPLAVSRMVGWQIVSASGGNPISMFGEWNSERFFPLSLFCDEGFYRL